jgi:hypothetical protein
VRHSYPSGQACGGSAQEKAQLGCGGSKQLTRLNAAANGSARVASHAARIG